MMTSARDNRSSQPSKNAPERQATTLNSTDAMAMVEHGSEVTLNVTTPVGTKFITTSTFMGCHSNNTVSSLLYCMLKARTLISQFILLTTEG